MSLQQKILLAMGTRPEIIKMAPVYHELKKHGMQPVLLHTGQHTGMASSLYDLFGIIPDFAIDLNRTPTPAKNDNEIPGACGLSSLSSLLLQKISAVMTGIDLSAVLVHGDTSSALMSALAAFYQQRPIGHVEAGLRSRNEYNPFPEEKNRVLIGQLAHWHFAPTALARENLLREGIDASHIHVVGNTIVEAAQLGADKLDSYRSKLVKNTPDLIDKLRPQLAGKKMVMVTAHRRENQASNIRIIAQAVLELMRKNTDLLVVWPVHPNPVVQNAVYEEMQNLPESVTSRLYITKPLTYPVLLWVLKNSWLVLTDSGGIQEEAVALNTPVLVLRETTERPEVIEAGAGMLIGTEKANIIAQTEALRHDTQRYESMCQAKNPFGDGLTASHICKILMKEIPASKGYIHAA